MGKSNPTIQNHSIAINNTASSPFPLPPSFTYPPDIMAEQDPHGDGSYGEVFDDGDIDTKQAQTVHRIRANSSIMQLKKILGEQRSSPLELCARLPYADCCCSIL